MNKWRNRREGRFSLRGVRKGKKSPPKQEEESLEAPMELVRSVSAPLAGAGVEKIKDYRVRRQVNTLFDEDEETKRPWRRDDGLNDNILDFIKTRRREKNKNEFLDGNPEIDEDDIDVAVEALQSFDAIGDNETGSLPDPESNAFFPIDEESKVEVTLDEYKNRLQQLINSIEEGSDDGSSSEESDSEEESGSDESDSEGSDSEYTYATDSDDDGSSGSDSVDESQSESETEDVVEAEKKPVEIGTDSDSDDDCETKVEIVSQLEINLNDQERASTPTSGVNTNNDEQSSFASTPSLKDEHDSPVQKSLSQSKLKLSYDLDDEFCYDIDDDDNELDSPLYDNIYDDDSVDSIEKLRQSLQFRAPGPTKMKSFRRKVAFSLKQTKTTMAEI